MVGLLPFMEQANVFNNLPLPPNAQPWRNRAPWNIQLPNITCPSDPLNSAGTPDVAYFLGKTSYRYSMGDSILNVNSGSSASNAIPLPAAAQPRSYRGMFGYVSSVKMGDVTDGTSNTLVMSERVYADFRPGTNPGASFLQGLVWNTYPAATLAATPGICMAERGPSGRYLNPAAVKGNQGDRWGAGDVERNAINTVLAPNGPGCCAGGSIGGNCTTMLTPPTSYHTGGVHGVLVDGSVHFISQNIDTGNLNAAEVTSGLSPYGVWGALGSKSGGEVGGGIQ